MRKFYNKIGSGIHIFIVSSVEQPENILWTNVQQLNIFCFGNNNMTLKSVR